MTYTQRIEQAFSFAHGIHQGQQRKGSGAPFITHVMSVAALVGENGGDEDQFIAALLHDAVEDGEGLKTLGEIREAFGPHVAELVEGCSDAFTHPKPPWLQRKTAYIGRAATAAPELRLIIAADKLHNVRIILRDLKAEGPIVWDRFQGRRDGSLWYYTEIVRVLGDGWDHPILKELTDAVNALCEAESHEIP